MESGGRTPEERRAAAKARAQSRRGEPPATGDEDAGPREPERAMARHYGGGDVYLRRRLIALGAVIVVIVLIFLLVGGC